MKPSSKLALIRRASHAVAVVCLVLSSGAVVSGISAFPAQARDVVITKGVSGNDVVIMARSGRNVLAVAAVKQSEFMCWAGRIYWDGSNSAWKIRMRGPSPYEPGKIYRDRWEIDGSYRSANFHLNRFTPRPLNANDYRVLKYCRKDIKRAGMLPSGL